MTLRFFSRLAPLLVVLAVLAVTPRVYGQSVDVTFRFIPDLTPPGPTVVRAFVPGGFNDWGQPYGSAGQVQAGDESQMEFEPALGEYRLTQAFSPGTYSYKFQYHRNASGSDFVWIADPLVSEVTGPFDDSVIQVADPMVFELAREEDESRQIVAVSVGVFGSQPIDEVTFTVNETTYENVAGDADGIYRLVLDAPVARGALFRVEALDAAGRAAGAEVGAIAPEVTDAPVPAGLADGITYDPDDPTRAWLVLRAPTNEYVYARGSFNGWAVSDEYLLARDTSDPLGTRWWTELTGLTPGTDVLFQYLVDGEIEVTDPYAARVLYPGQSGFPTGQSDFPVGVLTPGAPAFAWTDDGFEAPAEEDLVVYELLLRDFLADDSFTALADTLDYLVRLGVNTVELMPISQRDDANSWGYDPAFHFAVENSYGTPDEFKAFVDAAHARGLAVILDVVYNQATGQSPLVRLDNTGDIGPPNPSNPWANPVATHDFSPFNDLNHESALTQLWLDRANRWWIEEYHVDGYRFDFTSGFMQTGPFYQVNPSRIALLQRMIGEIREVRPEAIVILEHLTPIDEVRQVTAFGEDQGWPGSVSWRNYSDPYREATSGYPTDGGASIRGTYSPNDGLPVRHGVTYMESHDEQWMVWTNRNEGASSGGYDVTELSTALDRQKLAAAFFFTVPGPRMLWQFGEVGYGGGPAECLVGPFVAYPGDCQNGAPGRIETKPIRWDYWSAGAAPFRNGTAFPLTAADAAERAERRQLYNVFASLIGLRLDHDLFRSSDTQVTTRLGNVADRWIRLSLPDAPDGQVSEAVVFGNFGVTERTLTLTFNEARTWYDYFDGTSQGVPAGTQTFSLQPGEFHVWTDVQLDLPTTADEGATTPGALGLSVFPNPSARAATVRVTLAAPGDARVEAFDLLGRRVAVLADAPMAAGVSDVPADLSGLPAGVYLVRLTTETGVVTERLSVAR